MATLYGWLVSAFTLLPGRVLAALGFGVLSYTGYTAAVNSLVYSASNSINSLPLVVYQIAALSGFIDGFGVILSAIVGRSAMIFVDKFSRLSQ